MWATYAGFLLLTGLCIAMYLRRQGSGAETSRCPRCRAELLPGALLCSRCGVPLQAMELVAAAELEAPAEGAPAEARAHAVVRVDVCVGCSTCVDACPEDGALRVDGKLAVVDRGKCVGHGDCVRACPVGAIFLSSGEAVQRVRVPQLDEHFESNLPGLFIVGELGGRGLIKNAINEGKIAVERIAAYVASRNGSTGREEAPLDVVIVGSGPAGLSAALEALSSGLRYTVLEQGSLADTIRKYPRKKLLLAEPVKVPLYGDLWVADSSKETLIEIWEAIVANTGVDIRTGHRVEEIVRDGNTYRVRAAGTVFLASHVVLAMGRRGTPRRLGVPGEESDKVFYDIVEMEPFRNRRVLVVGGGDSAVESALGLANQEGTEVTMSYRGDAFNRPKRRNLDKLEAAVATGSVRPLLSSEVREILADRVRLRTAGGDVEIPNDDVIIRVGGTAPYPFLERMGVRIVEKSLAVPA